MSTQIVLLRAINVGSANRIAMPALREALGQVGYDNVRTYLQSGNVVLDTDARPDELAERFAALLAAQFNLNVPVIVRTRDELREIVLRNPLADVAADPKRYQVSFLSGPLHPETVERLQGLRAEPERLVVEGREIYAWHPDGVARSKLWNGLAGKLGVTATARNWTTVTALLEIADDA